MRMIENESLNWLGMWKNTKVKCSSLFFVFVCVVFVDFFSVCFSFFEGQGV